MEKIKQNIPILNEIKKIPSYFSWKVSTDTVREMETLM